MKDSNSNYEALQRSFLELTELKHILRKTQTFFAEVSFIFLLFSILLFLPVLQKLTNLIPTFVVIFCYYPMISS